MKYIHLVTLVSVTDSCSWHVLRHIHLYMNSSRQVIDWPQDESLSGGNPSKCDVIFMAVPQIEVDTREGCPCKFSRTAGVISWCWCLCALNDLNIKEKRAELRSWIF